MTIAGIDEARAAFERKAWGEAYGRYREAAATGGLGVTDLERLALAAVLTGRDVESAEIWSKAYHAALDAAEPARAVRCAFWLGLGLINRGEMARGGGWIGRAGALVEELPEDRAERGFPLIPQGLMTLGAGDPQGALASFELASEIGRRTKDPDLTTLGSLGRGQSLASLGRRAESAAALDEAMLCVTAGETSPLLAGIVYCATIESFQSMFDLRRVREWTEALNAWCAAQSDLVPFRGQCLVYRSEILQISGAWSQALDEAARAREWLSEPAHPAVGMAFYQLGELHRLRGKLSDAEHAYRGANAAGRSPQPGMALLALARGRVDAAATSIARAVEETAEPVLRAKLLPAQVEIALAGGDTATARAAADELQTMAAAIEAPMLGAIAAHARAQVLLATREHEEAAAAAREAAAAWRALDAPYETARARMLLGLACRALGDAATADLELDAARTIFAGLEAMPDVERIDALARGTGAAPGGLTPREAEVLTLVATGKTNRAIADELVISEKTVARHLSNIFTKLGLASRAQATAWAYEHGLARST